MSLNYTASKLYKGDKAQAVELLYLHDPSLNFQDFVDTTTATPSHVANNAYVAIEDGNIFGLSVSQGDIIRDDGTNFSKESIAIYEKVESESSPDPKIFLKDNSLTQFTPADTLHYPVIENASTHGMVSDYYCGQYNRTYFIYKTSTVDGTGGEYQRKIEYYDHDSGSFGGSPVEVDLGLTGADTHVNIVMVISKSGYILLAATGDDTEYRVYRSDSPEDISSFSKVTDASDLGYDTFNNYADIRLCKDKIIGVHRESLEGQHVVVSDDEGETWSHNQLLMLNTDHWAYATSILCEPEQGYFRKVSVQNHEDTGDGGSLNVAKTGILWTDDGVTWGNMEYYSTNKKRGYSKNISTEGSITESEFLQYYTAVDLDYGDETNGYPHYSSYPGIVTLDGSVVMVGGFGKRDYSAGTTTFDYVRTYIWNKDTLSWSYNDVATTTLPFEGNQGLILPTGKTRNEFDMFCKQNDGTYDQFKQYRTSDGGQNFVKIRDLTSFTANANSVSCTQQFVSRQGIMIFIENDGDELHVYKFDRKWAS